MSNETPDEIVPSNPTQKRITLAHAALEATRDFYAAAVAELMDQTNRGDRIVKQLGEKTADIQGKLTTAEVELRSLREMRVSLKSMLEFNSEPMTKEDLVDLTRRMRGVVNVR